MRLWPIFNSGRLEIACTIDALRATPGSTGQLDSVPRPDDAGGGDGHRGRAAGGASRHECSRRSARPVRPAAVAAAAKCVALACGTARRAAGDDPVLDHQSCGRSSSVVSVVGFWSIRNEGQGSVDGGIVVVLIGLLFFTLAGRWCSARG